ncbi:MAG: sporulation transcriptional regulator SpoIIID [Lachnospiraceae bacterium]|nr:sporulation transcriptional regulator SpoIIID [Lachnospiraceae bacterium]
MKTINPVLAKEVRKVMGAKKFERYIRRGMAKREKYLPPEGESCISGGKIE